MKLKYFALKHSWFDTDTEATYVCSMWCGYKWPAIMRGIKDGKVDEEGCSQHEFDVIMVEGND